jgi:hypothetical protein
LSFPLGGGENSAPFLWRRWGYRCERVFGRASTPLGRSLKGFNGAVQLVAFSNEQSHDVLPGHGAIVTFQLGIVQTLKARGSGNTDPDGRTMTKDSAWCVRVR